MTKRFQNLVILILLCLSLPLVLWGARTIIDLTRDVSGVLPGANGGTGVNSSATFPSSGTVAVTSAVPNAGSCTNQVETADNNGAAPTCASISNAMLGSGAYVKGVFHSFCTGTAVSGATTNFDFPGFGSTASICSTSLTSASGGTKMPSAGTIKNLFVNLSAAGKSGDKVTMLKNGSSSGAPTCTYATATNCSDTSTALTVATGDVITISNTTSASETAANISVSFELWN